MRKFIVSDIHGLGSVYKSIMNYLDNINEEEPVELYINGDLIDYGIDSANVLLDVKKRIQENKYKIIYLGGNHELLMHEVYDKRKKGIYVPDNNDWYNNGGWKTDYGLENELIDRNKILEIVDFISDLNIYHKFNEKINEKNIVLVHALCPLTVKDECEYKIKDDDDMSFVYTYVWTRENDPNIPFRCRIGNRKYFSIVGHTPNNNKYGYEYNSKENYLNIDGGCALYIKGYSEFVHVPLVEIKKNYLQILTFNNNNEIIYGNYFNGESIPIKEDKLNKERSYLNQEFKPKKMVKRPDIFNGHV